MKRTIKKMLVTGAISGLLSLSVVSAVYASNGWKSANGTWTYLNDNGQVHKGWLQASNGYYYMDLSNGVMTTGWKNIDSKWYYFKSNGIMATGWFKVGNEWYYTLSSGNLVQGSWLKSDSNYYYLRASGAMATGWVQSGNDWYYMSPSGAMLSNTTTADGYRLDASGRWVK